MLFLSIWSCDTPHPENGKSQTSRANNSDSNAQSSDLVPKALGPPKDISFAGLKAGEVSEGDPVRIEAFFNDTPTLFYGKDEIHPLHFFERRFQEGGGMVMGYIQEGKDKNNLCPKEEMLTTTGSNVYVLSDDRDTIRMGDKVRIEGIYQDGNDSMKQKVRIEKIWKLAPPNVQGFSSPNLNHAIALDESLIEGDKFYRKFIYLDADLEIQNWQIVDRLPAMYVRPKNSSFKESGHFKLDIGDGPNQIGILEKSRTKKEPLIHDYKGNAHSIDKRFRLYGTFDPNPNAPHILGFLNVEEIEKL